MMVNFLLHFAVCIISLVFSTIKQPSNLLKSLSWKEINIDEDGNIGADVVGGQV